MDVKKMKWFQAVAVQETPWDKLKMTAHWYQRGDITDRDFVDAIQHLFVDDAGEDWVNCLTSLSLLAQVICEKRTP